MPISKSEYAEFVDLYVAGATMAAMALRYHVDARKLKRILRRYKVPIRTCWESRRLVMPFRPPKHGYDELEIIACYKAGATLVELHKIFGVCDRTCRTIMAKHNVPMRTRSEAARGLGRQRSAEQRRAATEVARAAYRRWVDAGNVRPNAGQGTGKRAQRRRQLESAED